MDPLESVLANSKKITFLTGAGISEESGIPTFRGPEGLWKKYDPIQLASISGFYKDPKLVWEFYQDRQNLILNCIPNLGHLTIAKIEQLKNSTILTQNIDGLHKKAGSKHIVELHGNILKAKCTRCNFVGDVSNDTIKSLPPMCNLCGNLLRPDIVFFGEPLNQKTWKNAQDISSTCDIMFIIGTSLNVGPVNTLPILAKENGAILVEINPEPSVFNNIMDFSFRGKAGEILPKILSYFNN
jgi:NAD-dependent deacetylase